MIWIKNLEKKFGSVKALDDVTMSVAEGSVTAILGPNASGKSTLIKCILGLVHPDKGDIFIDDDPIRGKWLYRSRIGYMPQIAKFPDNLTVGEVFSMLKDIRQICPHVDEELYHKYKLAAIARRPLRVLSGGTRQKVNAAIAFLFSPEILILDEPTVGLDPLSAIVFKDKVKKERDNGRTVILTSHLASEVEQLADKIVYMIDGRPYFDGSIIDLKEKTGERKLERAIVRMMEGTDESRIKALEVRNT